VSYTVHKSRVLRHGTARRVSAWTGAAQLLDHTVASAMSCCDARPNEEHCGTLTRVTQPTPGTSTLPMSMPAASAAPRAATPRLWRRDSMPGRRSERPLGPKGNPCGDLTARQDSTQLAPAAGSLAGDPPAGVPPSVGSEMAAREAADWTPSARCAARARASRLRGHGTPGMSMPVVLALRGRGYTSLLAVPAPACATACRRLQAGRTSRALELQLARQRPRATSRDEAT
jgi:hypothetical protein